MKKLTRSKLIKKLDSVFSKYIRRKDAIDEVAKCVTCGVERHWKELTMWTLPKQNTLLY